MIKNIHLKNQKSIFCAFQKQLIDAINNQWLRLFTLAPKR